MLLRVALFAVLFAFCTASGYGRKGGITCSGQPVSDLRLGSVNELRGRWHNKFFRQTIGPDFAVREHATLEWDIPKKSLKANERITVTAPDGSCDEVLTRDFQYYEGIACVAEKDEVPEVCADQEWVHYVFGRRRTMQFHYYCADKNPGRRCRKFIARCMSKTMRISREDRDECQALWRKFNIGELPAEDFTSGTNACLDGRGDPRSRGRGGRGRYDYW